MCVCPPPPPSLSLCCASSQAAETNTEVRATRLSFKTVTVTQSPTRGQQLFDIQIYELILFLVFLAAQEKISQVIRCKYHHLGQDFYSFDIT